MYKKTHQNIVFLPTHNLEETSHFYSQILGLKLVLDQGSCQIFCLNDQSFLGFCEHIPKIEPADSVMICIIESTQSDVLSKFDDLNTKKVRTDGNPRRNEKFEIFHFFAFDPNGYRLEFQSFDNSDWAG